MERENPPAIVRSQSDEDQEAEVLNTPYDGVTFHRGHGSSGYRVEVVEHDCPACGFDRMVRRTDIQVEFSPEVRYWCLQPNCRHYAANEFRHVCHGNFPQMGRDDPTVFEEAD